MIYTNLTKKAMKIAYNAHLNQVDKSGMPYIFHPIYIAERMDDEESTIVALLHDTIEDSDLTICDLKMEGFSGQVIEALECLTHDKNIQYEEYIQRIKDNPLAKKVKKVDLEHNSLLERLEIVDESVMNRLKKYEKAKEMLSD